MVIQSKALMRIDALKGINIVIKRYGEQPDVMFKEFGLSPRLLASEDAYIPLETMVEFSEFLAQRLGIQDVGMQLAELQSIAVLGPVALLVHHQKTVADAMDMMTRYLTYHTSGAASDIKPSSIPGIYQMTYRLDIPARLSRRSADEQSFLNMVKILQLLVPPPYDGVVVEFEHQPVLAVEEYQARFGCSVVFGKSENRMYFPAEMLERELNHGNPQLSELAEKHIASLLAANPLDTAGQVASLVAQQLSTGHAGICQIAKQLNLHERTLQRRLEKQGVYFEDVVDTVRQEQAKNYLLHDELSLSQVAGLLGYGDQSAFNRACKRWTGLTPKKYRQDLRSDTTL